MARTEAYYRRLRRAREWRRRDRIKDPDKYQTRAQAYRRHKGPGGPKLQFTEEEFVKREQRSEAAKKALQGMGPDEVRLKYDNYNKLTPEEQAERRAKISVGIRRYINKIKTKLSPSEYKARYALATLHLREAAAAFRKSKGKGTQKWAWLDPEYNKYLSELGKERLKDPEYREWQRQRALAGWRKKKRIKPPDWVLKLRKIKRKNYIRNWKRKRGGVKCV